MRHRLQLVAALLLTLAAGAAVQASQQTLYTFDGNGNLTSKTEGGVVWTYTYDVRDLLTEVRRDGVIVEVYRYDYAGRRIRKAGPDGIVHYVWDGGRVLLETDGAGNTLVKYEYGPSRLMALEPATQGRSFHLFDALGTPTAMLGEDGSVQERILYDAWGVERSRSGESANRFGLTGHELDAVTGLYYAKARFLDPQLGRFLTEDPVEGSLDSPPSLHRYGYAHQNPTTFWDPDGRAVQVTAIGPSQQATKELDGQELYQLLVDSGIDRREAESYVIQEGLGADIGADRIPVLAASISAHVEADLEWVAKEGVKIAAAAAVGGSGAALAGASRLGILAADALAGVAYQGAGDLLAGELSSPVDYAASAGLSAGGAALARGIVGPLVAPSARLSAPHATVPGRARFVGEVTDVGESAAVVVVEGSGLGPQLAAVTFHPTGVAPAPSVRNVDVLPIGQIRAAGLKDAHHIIQDAAVRELPGYNRLAAPGVQVPGPSTRVGSPHYLATRAQTLRGGGTYGAERRIGYRALRAAGFSKDQTRLALARADEYFQKLGVTPTTATRIPGGRKRP